ncbi:restriction endonuclease subunit S [Methanobrevibacter sp.]|uniref:restriction endonuclease subunit S n=1 Tax=Methanobrevibacter sp. TaxID=66852 RepID=UPI00386B3391
MNSQWNEKNLNELYEFSSGLSKPSEEFGFGFPFLSFKTIFYNYYIDDELDELVNSTKKEQKTHSIKKGDVFLTRTSETLDELGMSCVALKDYPEATFNGFTKRLRPKYKKIIYPLYACYYFRSSIFRKYVDSMAIMTTRASLNNNILSKLPIFFPSYDEQKKIGYLLHNLSLKIELNKKINNHLENYVKYTFNSYFNKFLPFQEQKFVDSEYGFIPEGWQIGQIGDYCSIKSGFAFKSKWWQEDGIKVIKIKDINQGSIDFSDCSCVSEENTSKANEFKVQGGDLLIAMTGATLGKFSVVPKTDESLYVNQRVGKFFLGDNPLKSLPFIWGLLNQRRIHDEIINRGQGSAQPNVSPTDIMTIEIILPPKSVIDMFNTKFQPVFNLIINNMYEIDKLSKLRDVLLPKLMSGEINVSQVNYDLE